MAADARFSLLRMPPGDVLPLHAADVTALEVMAEQEKLAWLDLESPDAADVTALSAKLSLHPLAVEDLQRRGQRSKVDTYPGQYVIVAHEVRPSARQGNDGEGEGFELVEVHLIVQQGLLASVHWGPSPAVADVRRRYPRRTDAAARSAGTLLYELLDAISDAYFPLLDGLSEQIDDIQDRIVGGTDGSAALRDILRLKRQLLNVRRVVAPMRDVANTLLRHEIDVVDEATEPYFQDLYDHLVRVLDSVDLYREMIAAALDANLAVTSNNLNIVVKRLTAFTVILMVPTLIAGIYGMNFHAMPELSWPLGYAFALGLMAVAIAGLIIFFRARDWL
jgi:magnesium transporter